MQQKCRSITSGNPCKFVWTTLPQTCSHTSSPLCHIFRDSPTTTGRHFRRSNNSPSTATYTLFAEIHAESSTVPLRERARQSCVLTTIFAQCIHTLQRCTFVGLCTTSSFRWSQISTLSSWPGILGGFWGGKFMKYNLYRKTASFLQFWPKNVPKTVKIGEKRREPR